jgi:hypothetical protein
LLKEGNMPAEETTQQSGSSTLDQREETGYYQAYAEFAKTLRTWFIACGIGAPALVLSNKDLWNTVKGSGILIYIAVLFLLGVTFQVIEAFIYKTAMWHLYVGESDEDHMKTWWYKMADKVSESYKLELFFDVGAFIFFAIATILLVATLV